MTTQLELGDIGVDVVLKDIKNVHLSVHPPTGRVRIAAPARMGMEAIRLFAISKLGWIKEQQRKLREQERETPREYPKEAGLRRDERDDHQAYDGQDRPREELEHFPGLEVGSVEPIERRRRNRQSSLSEEKSLLS